MNWKIVKDEQVDDFGLFRTKKSTRINPRTDKPYTFFLMDGLDWVSLIALTPEDEVIMVKQYRHGSEQMTLELPGGCVEKGEDPAISAARELKEETGYEFERVEKLGSIFANPALQSMRLHCYLAHGATKKTSPSLDAGEDIQAEKIPLKAFLEKVKAGEVNHALMVATAGLLILKKPELLKSS